MVSCFTQTNAVLALVHDSTTASRHSKQHVRRFTECTVPEQMRTLISMCVYITYMYILKRSFSQTIYAFKRDQLILHFSVFSILPTAVSLFHNATTTYKYLLGIDSPP